ncbi:MAG: hypothetical protein JW789_00210 [Candidatus Aenigmarchaeota archaeon]|nr:hypothetical protein [Candidatus Aenigmarchaeota archaeon]
MKKIIIMLPGSSDWKGNLSTDEYSQSRLRSKVNVINSELNGYSTVVISPGSGIYAETASRFIDLAKSGVTPSVYTRRQPQDSLTGQAGLGIVIYTYRMTKR